MKIKKRNGDIVPFDKHKIVDAINKAFLEVDGILYETDTAEDIAEEALTLAYQFYNRNLNAASLKEALAQLKRVITVEQIQDFVEDALMRSERRDVARAYIRHRYKREIARQYTDDFMEAVKNKLEAVDPQFQNANVDELSFGGRTGEANDLLTRKYALQYKVSDMAKKNHENNEIYIHDLSSYAVGSHNCLSVPFDKLLANGFKTRQCDVRPAQSVGTAFQLVAVIFQLQSLQQFGGVSATHLDWTMVPYVRKSFYKHYKDGLKYVEQLTEEEIKIEAKLAVDSSLIGIDDEFAFSYNNAYNYAMDMTIKEIYQAVEGMYHNLNTLQSRSGNQLPFTSINYGTCTLPEGRLITKALLEVSIEGLGPLHKTSIFPCGIFQSMAGVNRKPGDPNYDLFQLALESTATRHYPNYANVDWSGNEGYDRNDPRTYFSTMGKCKLQLI